MIALADWYDLTSARLFMYLMQEVPKNMNWDYLERLFSSHITLIFPTYKLICPQEPKVTIVSLCFVLGRPPFDSRPKEPNTWLIFVVAFVNIKHDKISPLQ